MIPFCDKMEKLLQGRMHSGRCFHIIHHVVDEKKSDGKKSDENSVSSEGCDDKRLKEINMILLRG